MCTKCLKVSKTGISAQLMGETSVSNQPANEKHTRAVGSTPGLGTIPWSGKCNPLQYSCLGNSMGRGTCWAILHGVAKSRTGLSY